MSKNLTALCFNMSNHLPQDNLIKSDQVWLPFIPAGEFVGADGRRWVNSNPDDVVARFDKKRPFDIEHSTHIKAPKGEPAYAYGWILDLENRNGEIYALVEFTEDGIEIIQEKKYAFYSPAFSNNNGVVLKVVSSAFTNDPNLDVPALNNQQADNQQTQNQQTPNQNEENLMLKAILEALGLSEDANEDAVLTAIGTLKQQKADAEVAMNRAQSVDLNKYVPKETYDIALNRASTAEASLAEIEDQKIEALVDSAIEAGKVAPANKDMYVSLCRTQGGVDQFKSFIESAPSVVDKDKVNTPVATNKAQLDEHEISMCRKMGISTDEYLATKANMQTGA